MEWRSSSRSAVSSGSWAVSRSPCADNRRSSVSSSADSQRPSRFATRRARKRVMAQSHPANFAGSCSWPSPRNASRNASCATSSGPILRTERLPRHQQDGPAKPTNQRIAGFPTSQPRHFNDFAVAQIVKSVLHCHASGSSCLKESAGAAKDRRKPGKMELSFYNSWRKSCLTPKSFCPIYRPIIR